MSSLTVPRTSSSTSSGSWQDRFQALLPEIDRQLEFVLTRLPHGEREEARQAILVAVVFAYRRLVEQGREELAYAAPLVRFGYCRYRAGRLPEGGTNSFDVGSPRWRRTTGLQAESLADCQETLALADQKRATPAEIAALRVDFAAWMATLSARDRRLTAALARGEATRAVAETFRLTAGRVSQLRRELHASWRRFVGEPVLAVGG